jgi:3-hydroxyisobutyrate dehydrogenase-like beta-hydroxyacid dehydrogenase
MTEPVGYIGLGAIGSLMAQRIRQAGHPLMVWSRSPNKYGDLERMGATVAPSPAELATRCSVICICVSDTAAVEHVVFGIDGIARTAGPQTVVVDSSTIHPQATREMAQRLNTACGANWVDAPVSGGLVGARAGTLAVFAGGDANSLARVQGILGCFGGHITHVGPVGAGQTTKICNQIISAGTVAAIAEALTLAESAGMTVEQFPAALAGGWADSPLLRHYAPRMIAGEFQGSTRTMLKDLEIACDLAGAARELPVTALLTALYRRLIERGHVNLGISGIMRLYTDEPPQCP